MAESLNLVLKEDLQNIFNNFSECFGVRIAYFDVNGRLQRAGLNFQGSTFCRGIRQSESINRSCVNLDRKRLAEAAKKGKMIHYRCHAGLLEAVKPVYVDGVHTGFIMIGQIRLDDLPPERLIDRWQESGLGRKELLKRYRELPAIEKSRLESFLEIFNELSEYMMLKNMISLKQGLTVDRIIQYIENNITRDISLTQAASHVGLSKTSVTHMFRKAYGKSFKETVIEKKLSVAERILQNEKCSIREAAARVGYHDQFYFSRLYRKYRGMTPSAYKKSLS